MTIEEYSERMGYQATMEEYTKADPIYLNAGNLDKDTFCKDYKKHKGSVIIETLAERCNAQEIGLRDAMQKERNAAHVMLREADEIRKGGMDASADAIDHIAYLLLGKRDGIKWKLNKCFTLSETDKEFIINNL